MLIFQTNSRTAPRRIGISVGLLLAVCASTVVAGPPAEPVGFVAAYRVTTTHSLVRLDATGENQTQTVEMIAETSVTLAAKAADGKATYIVMSDTRPAELGSDGPFMPGVQVVRVTPTGRVSTDFSLGVDLAVRPFLAVALQGNTAGKKRNESGAVGAEFPQLNMAVYLDMSEAQDRGGNRIRVLDAPVGRVRSGPYPVDVRQASGSIEPGAEGNALVTSATLQVAVLAGSPQKKNLIAAVETTGHRVADPPAMTRAATVELLAELVSGAALQSSLEEARKVGSPASLDAAQKAIAAHLARFPMGLLSPQLKEALAQISESVTRAGIRAALEPGRAVPDLTAKTITDETFRLADFKGKVVLIDFWATWCPPCVADIPDTLKLYDSHKDDLVILGISSDTEVDTLKAFVKERGIKWRQVFEPDPSGPWHKAFGIEGYPTYILINRDGSIAAMGLRGPDLEQAIARLVSTH